MKRPGRTTGKRDQGGNSKDESLLDRIVTGTPLALRPPGETRLDLIDAAISRVARRKRKLERPPARWEVALTGALVGLATFAFLVGRATEVETVPLLLRALAAVVGAVAVAVYLRIRDRRR